MTTETLSDKTFTENIPSGNSPSDYEQVLYVKDVREFIRKVKANFKVDGGYDGDDILELIDSLAGKDLVDSQQVRSISDDSVGATGRTREGGSNPQSADIIVSDDSKELV
jgi:hypothetical protein